LRDIVRRTGCAVSAVRRELTGLANAEIIIKTDSGNRTYYEANTACQIFPELSGLLRKTAGLTDVLQKSLNPLSKKIKVAFIFGSFAANSARTASDVDLMVVGSCSFGKVVETLATVQNRLGREVNPSVYPVDEFKKKVVADNHFLKTVITGPKIFLIGDEDELAKLVK